MALADPEPRLIRPSIARALGIPSESRLDRGARISVVATDAITAFHGPRPLIQPFSGGSWGRETRSFDQISAGMKAMFESDAAARAWDRRVSALTRAIGAEKRVLV